MKRKLFCILLIALLACTLTACWPRDDPWHPYYYETETIQCEILAAYEGTPSDDYLLIPDSGCRFVLLIEGEEKTFGVPEDYYHLHKEDTSIPIQVEKKFRKDNDQLVNTEYYLVDE